MNGGSTPTVVTAGVALLERAMAYTLGGLLLVTPQALSRPTPCGDWDLRALLAHLNDSLRAMDEAITVSRVDLVPPPLDPPGDPVAGLRDRAGQMMGSWANARAPADIAIADRALRPEIVAATGAVEVAVHGWDVYRACGSAVPVPPSLAEELLELCEVLVLESDRPIRFARRVELSGPEEASPSDRLVAYLGRHPG
jgi:uncharacterized protein (TIGR03086 family)